MQPSFLSRAVSASAFLVLLVACGDGAPSSTGIISTPTYPATVSGTYRATTLTLTEAAGTTDLITEGVVIALVLRPGGTTTGSMTVPAAYAESGEEEILSLVGTYTYDAATGIVLLAHTADTFLRDTTWHAKGTQLNGMFDGGTYTLTVTLESGI